MSVIITKANICRYRSGSYPPIKKVKWRAGKLRSRILHNFPNLRSLDCSSNKLTTLEGIEVCGKLQTLRCHDNRLTTLAGIEECYQLRKLYCCNNRLTNLAGLEGCRQLRELFCAKNRLNSLENLNSCVRLIALNCSENRLVTLAGVENSPYLRLINCRDNRLVTIEHVNKLRFLGYIFCNGNPHVEETARHRERAYFNPFMNAITESDLSNHSLEIIHSCFEYDECTDDMYTSDRLSFCELLEHAWNRAVKSKQMRMLLHCIENLILSERSIESQYASLLSELIGMCEESKEDA